MSERKKIQLLIVLLLLAVGVYFYERSSGTSLPGGVSADTGSFAPLNVQDPALQLDRLRNAQNDEYKGTPRNIFVSGPPPPPPGAVHMEAPQPFVGPQQPPPPPPLQVPVEFYGVESSAGREVALFKNGDDPPIIVGEGDTFMNRFRLLRIGNQSAEVEEISTGRRATLPLVPPVDQGSGSIN